MTTIIPFLRDQAFDQHDINAMSMALDDICRALKLPDDDHPARRVIAERVIDLARTGERNASALRERVMKEASFGHRLACVAGSGAARAPVVVLDDKSAN
jgi:hypothetical protein